MQNISFSENAKLYKDGEKKTLSYVFGKRLSQVVRV